MKVLILSCNTGGGHNACAKAICDSFAEKGIVTLRTSLGIKLPAVARTSVAAHNCFARYFHMLMGIHIVPLGKARPLPSRNRCRAPISAEFEIPPFGIMSDPTVGEDVVLCFKIIHHRAKELFDH